MKRNALAVFLVFFVAATAVHLAGVGDPGFNVLASLDIPHENMAKPDPSTSCDGCESVAGAASSQSEGRTLGPQEIKLREARDAGDVNTIRRIEAERRAALPAQEGGESASGTTVTPSTTFGGAGTPQGRDEGGLPQEFGADVRVRSSDLDTREWNQDMASDSAGNLYVAWQDNVFAPNDYIQLYTSSDDGQTWTAYGFVQNTSASLSQPSVAVGEGSSSTLLLAYIIDDGVNIPHVEVATTPLSAPASFTVRPVPYYDFWESYNSPVIVTEYPKYSGWYAYMTTEAVFSSATSNINVLFWRSLDFGATWTDPADVPFGNLDTEAWIDPDVTFGTDTNDVFLSVYNDTLNQIQVATSTDFGATFNPAVVAWTLSPEPFHDVDPDIEAALYTSNVMIVCTKEWIGIDNVGQGYSTNNGATWTTLWNIDGSDNGTNEWAPELTANENGNSWHVAYTSADWWVKYNQRPQDLSDFWQLSPEVVNDVPWGSAAYPKKGIASNWASDAATIAWADFRSPVSGDYDTYADTTTGTGGDPIINIAPTQLDFVQTLSPATTAVADDGRSSQAVKVGDEESSDVSPASMAAEGDGVKAHVFTWDNASYIAVHFTGFALADGEYVEVASPEGTFSYRYDGNGKVVRGGAAVLSDFWATHIPGDTAVVRFNGSSGSFTIDAWVHGYEKDVVNDLLDIPDTEAICGADDKEWAPCYNPSTMYDRSRAVARLLLYGSGACTGWLVGSEGHLMTNEHCITSQADADNTDYEFMAEGATCTTDCSGWFSCSGTVAATSGTLVQDSASLDYALILLPTNVSATYGFLQLRDSLPVINERIYHPQHPGAKGKQLGVVDDQAAGDFCRVLSTSGPPCSGGPGDIEYSCDTEGGSSGSPVLAYDDHLVVALHHCRGDVGFGCGIYEPNRGVPIPSIIADLGANLPADAIGGGDSKTITIYNDGTADLTVTAMTKRDGEAWFSFTPAAPFTVPPSGSQVVTVTVDWPSVPPGFNDDQIIVESDDVDLSPFPNAVFITADKPSGPPITIALNPVSTIIPRGGRLDYTVVATNNTGTTQCSNYWTNVTLPNMTIYPFSGELLGPLPFCLNAFQSLPYNVSHPIPGGAPLGNYVYNAYVGAVYPVLDHEAHFDFQVITGPVSSFE